MRMYFLKWMIGLFGAGLLLATPPLALAQGGLDSTEETHTARPDQVTDREVLISAGQVPYYGAVSATITRASQEPLSEIKDITYRYLGTEVKVPAAALKEAGPVDMALWQIRSEPGYDTHPHIYLVAFAPCVRKQDGQPDLKIIHFDFYDYAFKAISFETPVSEEEDHWTETRYDGRR